MKKKLFLFIFALFAIRGIAQNPGLIISEILANPAGTDSCREYVELLATKSITFPLTPYTIIVNNNGNATSQGWIAGGTLSYAFEINTGTVTAGTVIYVGGSCMTPTTNVIKTLNVKYVNGDGGIGTAAAAGVFGNGGGNADGVAVFSLPVASITNTTVPTDAIFYGTGVGSASVTGGTTGYELPVNEFYSGGKFVSGSFFGPDPGSDVLVTATGLFNTNNNTWVIPRVISSPTTTTDGITTVSLTNSPPAIVSFFSNDTTVSEGAASANIYVKLTSTSTNSSAITVSVSALSTASGADYSMPAVTLTFAANAPVNSTYPITINLTNDAIAESAEYIVLRFANPLNLSVGSISQFAFYIADNDKLVPSPSNAITLNLLSSFSNTVTGSNSAEIVAHDPTTQRLYIANSIGGKLDIVNFINPSSPSLLYSIPITSYGNINSIAVFNGTVAAAIENGINPQDSGRVVFFNQDGVFLKQVKVGMMPDMITFNHAGTKVLTANEGEPNQAYTSDPDGSVGIIDISGGIPSLSQSNVAHATFTVYNGQEAALRAQGIRIYGPGANAAKDFEPEYIAIAKDDSKAWVTLQENNAIAEINLTTNSVTALRALGTKDHSLLNNGMDASNVTRSLNIANVPVKGLYLPDAIATYTVGGVNYVITANEGDSRAYSGFTEEQRISAVNLDPVKFPYASQLKNNYVIGRLNITDKLGDTDNDTDLDTIYSYGSRSFSIWNASTGVQVYDSKDDFEMITATNSYSLLFNASNSNNTKKDRSDDKGPEPEGVTIGTIGANTYAFIALERTGGVMVYDVTNPLTPVFVTYVNNRTTSVLGPDLGAEGIIFIHQSQSPNGQHIVIAANEVSSTLSIWGIAGCPVPISSSISVTGPTTNICSANVPVLSVPLSNTLTYQWSRNGAAITGATLSSISASLTGSYSVSINGGANCSTGSLSKTYSVNTSPTLAIAGASAACIGAPVTLTVSGASTYVWNTTATGNVIKIFPTSSGVYSVIGTATNNCTASVSKTISVYPFPTISINGGATPVCQNQPLMLTASGASTYTWNTGANGATLNINPALSTTYFVDATDANGCKNSATKQVTVNPAPVISISTPSSQICTGQSAVLTATGANTYTWSNTQTTASISVAPGTSTSYVVMGTGANTCTNSSTYMLTVLPLPVLNVMTSSSVMCFGESATITASGASNYSWDNGTLAPKIVVSPSATTVYTVTGTGPNNCSAMAQITQTVSECTAIHELNGKAASFVLYPNPARNEIMVSTGGQDPVGLKVYNAVGALVLNIEVYTPDSAVNTTGLSKGIYFVRISSNGKDALKKLIIE